jgi:capsular exopolysaccharide synthesis family protein
MSRIQDILNKAEREGAARRTRSVGTDVPAGPSAIPTPAPTSVPRPVLEPTHIAERREARVRLAEPPAPEREARPEREVHLDRHLIAALAPQSLAAEQYRSLRTRISRVETGRALRAIIITSPAKGDGKSLTAANLALAMGEEFSQRVVLIDADLRRPSVHHLFGLPESPGLTDVLMGGAPLDDVLVTLADHNLTVLPSGVPPNHPAELLGSAAMRRTLDTLRTRFDRLILDMPPVSPLADVHIAAAMADGILMIVRAGMTQKPAIERALAGLDMTKVLGLVLNEVGAEANYQDYAGYRYIAG